MLQVGTSLLSRIPWQRSSSSHGYRVGPNGSQRSLGEGLLVSGNSKSVFMGVKNSGRVNLGLNTVVVATFYRKMRAKGKLLRRTKRKTDGRFTNFMKAIEASGDGHMDELVRLAQEDVFTLKRSFLKSIEERQSLVSSALEEEEANLRRDQLQITQGKLENLTSERINDPKLMSLHRRRLGNLILDVQIEDCQTAALKDTKEDDEARRRRRANTFKLSEWDAERGHEGDYIDIPDTEEYAGTRNLPSSMRDALEFESALTQERIQSRYLHLRGKWMSLWAPEQPRELTWQSTFLKRYPSLRWYWQDDDRCWRIPSEWHKNYSLLNLPRLSDAVRIQKDAMIAPALESATAFWKDCDPVPEAQHLEVWLRSNLLSPPTIAPSMWTYPGDLVCLMNHKGQLDIYRRMPGERDVWWIRRLKLSENFMKKIPLRDYSLSGAQIGENHLALFAHQTAYSPTRQDRYGWAWIVPKGELESGKGAVAIPPVPLGYFKPFSVKGKLFALGYESPFDSTYQVFALDLGQDEDFDKATWTRTEISGLPLFLPQQVWALDYPETMHILGTASICISENESHVYITVPTKTGQTILSVDTETWDFNITDYPIPSVWGAALFHDAIHDRLILAGGLGPSGAEPIVRTLHLPTQNWYIDRTSEPTHLTAYSACVDVGYGSKAMVGGFWRTGHKSYNVQPVGSVFILETSPADEFFEDHYTEQYRELFNSLPARKLRKEGEEGEEEGNEEEIYDDDEFDLSGSNHS